MGTWVSILTFVHVALSLVGIAAGFVVMYGLLTAKRMDGWTALFLSTTVATSVTGYFFPYDGFKPSYVVGAVSLLALALAIFARYSHRLAGAWRWLYVVGAATAQYLDVVVLFIQGFRHVPALNALAPTQSEPPFLATQIVLMVQFIAFGVLAVKRFRPVSE